MSEFSNHNLKFKYIKEGKGYVVGVAGRIIGRMRKAGGGWESLDVNNVEFYTTGNRTDSAERLAHRAGLLDGNYNAIEAA